jgi:hypothetical protein
MNNKPNFITVIQDCNDEGTKGRITTRVQNLFEGIMPSFVAVGAYSDLEAAGNLVDILDSSEGGEGVILVNAAPRHGKGKNYKNGVPFGYFYYKNTLVVLTIDDIILNVLKDLNITDSVEVFDIPTVMDEAFEKGLVEKWVAEKTKNTQFRSLEFEPRIASWIWKGEKFTTEKIEISGGHENGKIYLIDNFGNCKTTMTASAISKLKNENNEVETKIGKIKVYDWLHELPNDETGLIKGSSGLNQEKFMEVMVQGKSAADVYDLSIGDNIFEL